MAGESMIDWVCEFIIGFGCTYIAVKAWERLKVWWQEGKEEFSMEELDHDDPRLRNIWMRRK